MITTELNPRQQKGPYTPSLPERYLLFCTTGLGDSLFCTPALRFLRKQRPSATITVVVKNKIRDLFSTNPHLDELLGYHRNPFSLFAIRRRLIRRGPYRAAFLFHVNDEIEKLINGVICQEIHCIKNFPGLKERAQVFPKDIHHKRQWEDFADMIAGVVGGKNDNDAFELPLTKESHSAADAYYSSVTKEPGLRLGLQLGGSHLGKCWPPERFAQLAAVILMRYGGRVFLNAPQSETRLFNTFMETIPPDLRRRCHRLPFTAINGLAALLARMDLLVTNDTGPLHVAVSQGTPVVALKAHDSRTYPYTLPRTTPLRRSLFVYTDTPTSGSAYHTSHEAMTCISLESVLAEIEGVLEHLKIKPLPEERG